MIALLREMKDKGIKVEGERPPSRIFFPREPTSTWCSGFGSLTSLVGWIGFPSGEIGAAIFVIHDFSLKSDEVGVPFFETDDGVGNFQKILGDGDGGSKKGVEKSIWDQRNHLYEIFYQDDFN